MSDVSPGGPTALCVSASPEETRALGEALGRHACAGDLIALIGDLGSGKTVFVAGLAAGLGIDPDTHVSSPTFTIMHRYLGRLPLYHIDLYRIDGPEALLALGLEEYLEGDGVAVVEWAEHGVGILPTERLTVRLWQTGSEARTVELLPSGDRYRRLVREMMSEAAPAPTFLKWC
ncbi:MAG: tRNA (adenosine(37)-N6)-threonylcarbamoyltransferase complex ATPase subunit type 1 TsaE [Candidatus Methylomirabilis oxyfera]|nr:tRNA (adenosine(37)-N6)-threonylcarbamoyltransferase complex ATPase subunit type 1 TsaE [Candidatus Methylomirabilis oxyfera]